MGYHGFQVVMVVNGSSYAGVGWRPRTLTPACKNFPELLERGQEPGHYIGVYSGLYISEVDAEPTTEPEAKSEPEPEPKSTAEPEPEPKATAEPEPEPKPTAEPAAEPTTEPTSEPTTTKTSKPNFRRQFRPKSVSARAAQVNDRDMLMHLCGKVTTC